MVPRLRSTPHISSDRVMMAKKKKVFKEEEEKQVRGSAASTSSSSNDSSGSWSSRVSPVSEEESNGRIPRRSYLQIKAILKRRKKQTTRSDQVQPVNLLLAIEAKLESDQQRKALGKYICPLKVPRTVERLPTSRGYESTKLMFVMAQGLLPKCGPTSRKEMKRSNEHGADADERRINKLKVVTTTVVSVRLNT